VRPKQHAYECTHTKRAVEILSRLCKIPCSNSCRMYACKKEKKEEHGTCSGNTILTHYSLRNDRFKVTLDCLPPSMPAFIPRASTLRRMLDKRSIAGSTSRHSEARKVFITSFPNVSADRCARSRQKHEGSGGGARGGGSRERGRRGEMSFRK